MRRFTQLFIELDRTTRTTEKLAALERYFREAPPRDAAHALFFLTGNRFTRAVSTRAMADAAAESSGLPGWLIDDCHEAVGDFSETVALLLPEPDQLADVPLHTVVEDWIRPLVRAPDPDASRLLRQSWARLDRDQAFLFNKLIRGNFRVGVSRRLVVRALAAVAGDSGLDPAVMAHRLSGRFEPTERAYRAIISADTAADDASRPYPFCLAAQLNDPPEALGPIDRWQVEYKWDGIRAQLIRRAVGDARAQTFLWSRGEELITHQFPELTAAAAALPPGTVLDGEILAWSLDPAHPAGGRPLSFNALQTRLNRKDVQPSLFDAEGVAFLAFDLLELDGRDLRERPLRDRRDALAALHARALARSGVLRLSPVLGPPDWTAAAALRADARSAAAAEGLMLKHLDSPYHVGRVTSRAPVADADDPDADAGIDQPEPGAGGWWKWKLDPFTVDAVLIYAQPGSGRRAGLFTDYTFGVWDGSGQGELLPFAKAYSGLTDEEIRRVDAFVRRNTIGRKGPIRVVKPELVFEIGFEGLRASSRHRSGIAVRFPRILRWRTDKAPADADTLATVQDLLARHGR